MVYVVGQSTPKMYRRITHKDHSTPFFNDIVGFPTKDLKSPLHLSHTSNKYDSNFLVAFKEYRGQSIRDSIMKDLLSISPDSSPHDRDKLRILQEIQKSRPENADQLFPRLLKLASEHTPPLSPVLYTNKTRKEFHQLFCLLLLGYRASLQELSLLKKSQIPPTPGILYASINNVLNHMVVLHPLAHSKAIVDYFLVISTAIRIRRANEQQEGYTSSQDLEDEWGDPEDDTDEGIDDAEVQQEAPASQRAPVTADVYTRWLQLQVVYYDAITFLLPLMREEFPANAPITMEVFSPPYTGSKMKPWRDVVSDVISRVGFWEDGHYRERDSDTKRKIDAERSIEALEDLKGYYPNFKFALNRLASGTGFKGRMHCEACMVILMFPSLVSKIFVNGISVSISSRFSCLPLMFCDTSRINWI
jgi:hypothetical protein